MRFDYLYRAMRSAFVFFMGTLVMACGEDNPDNPTPEPGPENGERKIVVLNQQERPSVEEVREDGTVVFDGTAMAEKLSPGTIICSEPTDNAPYGFLYKVKSVKTEGGRTVVTTQTVELAEAVGDGHGKAEFSLTDHIDSIIGPDGNEIGFTRLDGSIGADGGIEIPIDLHQKVGDHVSFKLKGMVSLKADVFFEIDFRLFGLRYLEFWVEPSFKTDISAEVEAKIEDKEDIPLGSTQGESADVWTLEAFKVKGSPVVVQVGLVPVPISPVYEILFKVSLAGKVTMSAKLLELDYRLRSGVLKDDDGYHLISEDKSKEPRFLPLGDWESGETYSLRMEGALKLAPTVKTHPMVYNQDIKNFSIDIGLPFKAKITGANMFDYDDDTFAPYANPNLKVTWGLDAGFHFNFEPIISQEHFSFEPSVTFLELILVNKHFYPMMSNLDMVEEKNGSATLRYTFSEFNVLFDNLLDHGIYIKEGEYLVSGDGAMRNVSLGPLDLSDLKHIWNEYPVDVTIDDLKPATAYTAIPYFETVSLIPFRRAIHYGNPFVFFVIGEQNPLRAETLPPTELSSASAILNGYFEDGGTTILEKGFCISSQNDAPTLENNHEFPLLITQQDSDQFLIRDLTPQTTYYFRAFATNQRGTVYGNVLSFTTLANDNGAVVIDIPGENL